MAFEFSGGAGAADVGDEDQVDEIAHDEHQWPGEDRRNIGSECRAEDRLNAERAEKIKCGVHAEHHEVALREIDDAHDAEYQGQADAHEPVKCADEKPGREGLKYIFKELDRHCAFSAQMLRAVVRFAGEEVRGGAVT